MKKTITVAICFCLLATMFLLKIEKAYAATKEVTKEVIYNIGDAIPDTINYNEGGFTGTISKQSKTGTDYTTSNATFSIYRGDGSVQRWVYWNDDTKKWIPYEPDGSFGGRKSTDGLVYRIGTDYVDPGYSSTGNAENYYLYKEDGSDMINHTYTNGQVMDLKFLVNGVEKSIPFSGSVSIGAGFIPNSIVVNENDDYIFDESKAKMTLVDFKIYWTYVDKIIGTGSITKDNTLNYIYELDPYNGVRPTMFLTQYDKKDGNIYGFLVGGYGKETFYYEVPVTFPQKYTVLYTGTVSDTGGSVSSKPVAKIQAPISTHTGNTVVVTGSGTDPNGLAIVDYEWTTTNGQVLTGIGGSIKVDSSVTLTLKVKNSAGIWSDIVSHTINTENKAPTAKITVPSTIYLGDDVYVSGSGQDPDGDPLDYYWDKPNDMYGTLEGKNGTVYFMNLGTKTFGLTVADPTGDSGYATATTTVIAPSPGVNIETKGTLKENRKVILDGTGSIGGSKRVGLDWTKAKWEVTAVSGGTASDIKTASSYNGSQTMDFVFKKPGTYKAKLTLTNTLGLSGTQEKTFVIEEDKAPIADFTIIKNIIRDPNDLSSTGKPQGTFEINDLSISEDGDSIVKRAYFVVFDSDNDNDWDEEMCYVYDLDSTLTKQMPNNDSDNLHWRSIGLYKNFATFDISNINTGNLTGVSFKSTHVGKCMFDEVVKEEFGQSTIEQFVTPTDRKTGTTYE